jgi:hypothetical protein
MFLSCILNVLTGNQVGVIARPIFDHGKAAGKDHLFSTWKEGRELSAIGTTWTTPDGR